MAKQKAMDMIRKYLSSPITLSLMLAATLVTSCDKAPKGDDAIITDQVLPIEGAGEAYRVDTTNSWIQFTGYGVGKNHPGTFKIQYGRATATKNVVTGGSFVIDVRSMDMAQEGDMIENKLRPHLLSGDFFSAEEFGTAKFEITRVEPYEPKEGEKSLVEGANFNVSGNLEIRRVTKNITFPARLNLDGTRLEADANFDIDRREWQMAYGNDRTLGDKFISETVNIKLHIEAMAEDPNTDVGPRETAGPS